MWCYACYWQLCSESSYPAAAETYSRSLTQRIADKSRDAEPTLSVVDSCLLRSYCHTATYVSGCSEQPVAHLLTPSPLLHYCCTCYFSCLYYRIMQGRPQMVMQVAIKASLQSQEGALAEHIPAGEDSWRQHPTATTHSSNCHSENLLNSNGLLCNSSISGLSHLGTHAHMLQMYVQCANTVAALYAVVSAASSPLPLVCWSVSLCCLDCTV